MVIKWWDTLKNEFKGCLIPFTPKQNEAEMKIVKKAAHNLLFNASLGRRISAAELWPCLLFEVIVVLDF